VVGWESSAVVTDFLAWHAALVRSTADQSSFTHELRGMRHGDRNELEGSPCLSTSAPTTLPGTQDNRMARGRPSRADFRRSLKPELLSTETNAANAGLGLRGQFPPYDGQMRIEV